MHSEQINESLIFHLRNVALLRFSQDSVYEDIISPFSRLYLITEGKGHLVIGSKKIPLEAGNLYLIPSFTSCSYYFGAGLSHYYIHFSIDQMNGLNVFNLYPVNFNTASNELDYCLFKRILEINPDLQLPHHHPNVYQTKLWLNKKVTYQSAGLHLETIGILKQLFSRFLKSEDYKPATNLLKYNIQPILLHIQNNLGIQINVKELAEMSCLSKDHFSRIFKTITGYAPCDYIIRKRIERTQFLLLTTNLGHSEIAESTGFASVAYFSRIFKKYTNYSPAKYRKQRG